MDNNSLMYSKQELKHSESILVSLDPKRFKEFDYYHTDIINKKFGADFDGNKIRKSKYINCQFSNVDFNGTSGESSIMTNCRFYDCSFENARFDNSDFTDSKFLPSSNKNTLTACGFSNSNFTNVQLNSLNISGSNFVESWFQDSELDNTFFVCCNFEGALFDNVEINNCNFSKASLEFVEFNNCIANNSIFQIFSILHSYNGLKLIEKYKDCVYLKFPDSDKQITGNTFLSILDEIEAYFYYKKDFFALANISIFFGKSDNAFKYILFGLDDSFKKKDFKLIRYICKLASLNLFFTKAQLSQLYSFLQNNEQISELNYFEYNNYLNEMDNIKKILIDNPYNLPQMKISIETDIDYNDTDNVAEIIKYINKTYNLVSPDSPTYLTISHNSPDIFDFFLSSDPEILHNTFIVLSICFLGVTSAVVNLIDKHNDIELKKLQKIIYRLDIEEKSRKLFGFPDSSLETKNIETKKEAIAPKCVRKRIKRIKFSINSSNNNETKNRTFEIENTEEYE
ncbi:MAG: pentapeptide repeat-containing protein [Candidatus Aphodocola sp.]